MKTILPYAIAVGSVFILLVCSPEAQALKVEDSCSAVETIFVRGSGDSGTSKRDGATNAFTDSLEKADSSAHTYILGDESYNNYQYPHVAIAGFEDNGYANGLGAIVSSGEHYTYGESVDQGVGELTGYLQQRIDKCPDAKYIIGGYSQGAQVVDEALPILSKSERDKITYIALFGNPKLYLPEAHSFEAYQKDPAATGDPLPDSCYGVNLSPWHNVIDDCLTYSGKLYTMKGYTAYPIDVQARVHDWCFDDDGICDGEKESWGAGHTKYPEKEGVPRAVNEALIASGLRAKPSFIDLTDTSKRYDVLFEIPMQCTPLFRFPAAIPSLAVPYAIHDMGGIDKQLYGVGENIYGIDYGQYENDMKRYVASLWRENTEHIRYRISPLNCADEYVGQSTTLRSFAAMRSSEMIATSSLTTQTLTDPISDYDNTPIISEIPDDPVCLTSPNCQIIDSASNVITQPTPIYPAIKNITNLINRAVSYNLAQSPSLSMYDTYLWDINADGAADITTSTPTLSYAYPYSYAGPLRVTALASTSGLSASTEFNVTILSSYKAPARPLAPIGLTAKRLLKDSVSVSWTKDPTDTVTAGWLIRVDNFPIAKTTLPTTLITITDMHFDEGAPRTITIAGLTSSELEGTQSSVTVLASLPNSKGEPASISTEPNSLGGKLIQTGRTGAIAPPSHHQNLDFAFASQESPNYLFDSIPDTEQPLLPSDSHSSTQNRQSKNNPMFIAALITVALAIVSFYIRKRR